MIVSDCQITMALMWRLSLAMAALSLTYTAALPKPQEHGNPEHNMELGNIDNVGDISQMRIIKGVLSTLKSCHT